MSVCETKNRFNRGLSSISGASDTISSINISHSKSSQDMETSGPQSTPSIPQVDTFDSSVEDARRNSDVELATNKNAPPQQRDNRREFSRKSSEIHHDYHPSLFEHWCEVISPVLYISAFAVIGTTLRVYLGRLLGLDCVLYEQYGETEDEFFSKIAREICITSDGKFQRGGALFIDLPANMIGSFIMGIISPPNLLDDPFPWFRKEHPLQHYTPLVVGLKVGLCGCLTTFASWNTQMVIMADGTDTEFGSQVAPAIFGYIIGAACAVASFVVGQQAYGWVAKQRSKSSSDSLAGTTSIEDNTARNPRETHPRGSHFVFARLFTTVVVVALFCFYALNDDGQEESLFYRRMWMASVVAPLGAILRWRLSSLNTSKGPNSGGWFPWGTFVVNTVAAVISVTAEALNSKAIDPSDDAFKWVSPTLAAVEIGFAGSLSTVSALVREMAFEPDPSRANFYCSVTIVCSMLLSLAVYSPIIRYG